MIFILIYSSTVKRRKCLRNEEKKFSFVARSIIHNNSISTQIMCEMRPDEGNINQVSEKRGNKMLITN